MVKPSTYSASVSNLFCYVTARDKIFIFAGTVCAIIMGMLQPIVFYAISSIYGEMGPETTPEEYLEKASEICFYMLWGGILLMVCGSIAMISWISVGARQSFSFRTAAFSKLLDKDCKWFDSNNISEIAPALSTDSLKVERATGDKMVAIIAPLSVVVTGFCLCIYNDLKLTLYCLGFWIVIISAFLHTKKGIEMKTRHSNIAYMKASGVAEEGLMEIKTVASLNAQKYKADKFSKCLKESEKYTIKVGLYTGLGITIGITVFQFNTALLYYLGAISIKDEDENWIRGNQIGLTEVRAILYVGLMLCSSVSNLLPALKIFSEGRYAASRLLKIIEEDNEVYQGDSRSPIDGKIEFKDVCFSYPSRPDNPVLKNMSFKIRRLSKVAIVGPSGSGKSTIAQLLLSLYSPSSGQIRFSSIPLESFDKNLLRRSIALVNQEPFLFNTSIFNNILYGNLKASEKEVKDAAFKAGALDFIESLPEGFETIVGCRGSEVSGGQKQRIVIARAILRKPRILILDEATSALDRSTEVEVVSTIEECVCNCTQISIAQNLLTIKNSDKIFVIESGCIKEEGKHRELMRMRGTYYRLYSYQKIQEKFFQDEEREDLIQIESSKEDQEINQAKEYGKRDYIKKVLSLSEAQRVWLGIAILGSVIIGSIYPFIGAYSGLQISLLITTRGEELAERSLDYSIIMMILGVVFCIGFIFQTYGYPKTSSSVTSKLRRASFSALLGFDCVFYANNHHSVLGKRLASDCETINDIGGTFLGILGAFIVGVFVSFGVSTFFAWQISLLIIIVLPIALCSMIYGLYGSMKGLVDYSYAKSEEVASDSMLNYKTIKTMSLEHWISDAYTQFATEEYQNNKKKARKSGLGFGLSLGIMFWYYALILWHGARMFEQGEVTFRDMVASIQTILAPSDILLLLIIFLGDVGGGFLAAKRVFGILDYKPSIDIASKDGVFPSIEGRIEFCNVSFAYPKRNYLVLKDVSFVVSPATKLAVIGRSGSGKSTLGSLLIRLFDPLNGSITIDYTPITKYNLKHLRNNIGIVIQEPILFSGTIRENIVLGSKASEEEVQEAVKVSLVSRIIENSEEGLDRDVGFKGSGVSGGQKQRIAIARTLLRKPKIVIFDEATSSLDSETESVLLENIERSFEGLTRIVIAHRLKTVKDADSILVLDSGRVLEFGTQEELYEKRGYFYNVSKDFDRIY